MLNNTPLAAQDHEVHPPTLNSNLDLVVLADHVAIQMTKTTPPMTAQRMTSIDLEPVDAILDDLAASLRLPTKAEPPLARQDRPDDGSEAWSQDLAQTLTASILTILLSGGKDHPNTPSYAMHVVLVG